METSSSVASQANPHVERVDVDGCVERVDADGLVSAVLGEDVCLDELPARELGELFQRLEVARRRVDAAITEVVAHADVSGKYAADGHASVRGWTKALARWSNAQAATQARTARLTRDLDVAQHEYASGRLGLAQVGLLGRLRANPRCGHMLGDSIDLLIDSAQNMSFDDFTIVVKRWETLADLDGADQDANLAHYIRNACCITDNDGRTHLDAHVSGVQAQMLKEIFDRFYQAETEADWDEARARLGDAVRRVDLERSDEQRRADALVAIFRRAASAHPDAKPPDPVVNILVDVDTLEHLTARAAGDNVEPLDPAECRTRRCETVEGDPVAPADIIAAMLVGQVRRVVVESPSTVIDLGRRSRLFTGSARVAAQFRHHRCTYPGCGVPTKHAQIDHVTPWIDDGLTQSRNAQPHCGRHNRWKETGYRTWQDDRGYWHTRRLDGTKIVAV